MTTLQVNEDETVTLSGGTQLAVVEDGQCYLIDLSASGEAISMTPTPVIFQKVEHDVDDLNQENGLTLQYFSPNPNNPSENHQIYLDDEQARAVANLLEFHNQSGGYNGIINSSGISPEIKPDLDVLRHQTSIGDSQIVSFQVDPLAFDVPVVKKQSQGLKTYGKKNKITPPAAVSHVTVETTPPELEAPHCHSIPNTSPQKVTTKVKVEPSSSIISPEIPNLKRKRRFIMDSIRTISVNEFKQQLTDTSDIVQKKMDCAPPNKRAMYHLTYGGVGKFFAYPGRKILSVPLSKLFFSRLTMTTDSRGNNNPHEPLIPLDSELRTPAPTVVDTIELNDLASLKGSVSSQVFNDALAKKTANSFDMFCKGMTKPPKYEYKRKTTKASEYCSSIPSTSARLSMKRELDSKNVTHETNQSTAEIKEEGETHDEITVELGPSLFDDTSSILHHSGSGGQDIIYTIDRNSMLIKTEVDDETGGTSETEIYLHHEEGHGHGGEESHDQENDYQEYGNNSNGGCTTNFDMLIAAAEQHKSLPSTNSTITASVGDDNDQKIKVEIEDKSNIVFCTSAGDESIENLIILGENGEQYRVTSSNHGELTLWPVTELVESANGIS